MAFQRLLGSAQEELENFNTGSRKSFRSSRDTDPWKSGREKTKTETRNPAYGKVIPVSVEHEAVKKPQPRVPRTDMESYLANVKVCERIDARFAIKYRNGNSVLTFHGDFLYFKSKSEALKVNDDLKNLGADTVVCFGPIGSKGREGQPI